MTIIIGLLMFMFLILVHELGHFIVAKLSGIKVNEFSIGMGPNVYNKTKGETKYSIRALPLGGYVAMEGEDSESSDPRSYENAAPHKRFLTILAGPLMNYLTAFLLILIVLFMNGAPTNYIGQISDGSPAQTMGLENGDKIISIDDKPVNTFNDISLLINDSKGNPVNIKVERDGQQLVKTIEPELKDGVYLIGIIPSRTFNPLSLISEAVNQVISITILLWQTLRMLFTGLLGLSNLSGPIGVIQQAGAAASMGIASLLTFTALISINLGFFNLLPIPALDGSKLVLIIIEKIIGRPLNKKVEQTITIIGFFALMALIIIVSVKDIFSLF